MTNPLPIPEEDPALIERVARALKANIAKQFNATPIPGFAAPDDWTATGGTLELEELARAALQALPRYGEMRRALRRATMALASLHGELVRRPGVRCDGNCEELLAVAEARAALNGEEE